VPHENRVGVLTYGVLLRSGRRGWESRGVLLTLVYMSTRLVLAVVTILVRREVSEDAELVPLGNTICSCELRRCRSARQRGGTR
jgi:hypothetical protein